MVVMDTRVAAAIDTLIFTNITFVTENDRRNSTDTGFYGAHG